MDTSKESAVSNLFSEAGLLQIWQNAFR
eukprot:SAG31_NODE_43654_length_266_cov_0.622754_1_plen_27_part_01